MNSLLESVRGLERDDSDVLTRVEALGSAADAARGVVDDGLLGEIDDLAGRARARLRLSGDHAVVALCGATGSGKSSLFNALTGLDLAVVGRRRPSTTEALACVWGDDPAMSLLAWLGIPNRQQISHGSSLQSDPTGELEGLVLLDLPDHDSTAVGHRLVVDKLVDLVDVLVWVVDPQKYADAALHDGYIEPLATHGAAMVFVLNHADELEHRALRTCVGDLRRLLQTDGVTNPVIVTTSARTGDGVDDLRRLIRGRVRDKSAAQQRIEADVERAADRMAELSGENVPPRLDPRDADELVEALSAAAGSRQTVDAMRRAYVGRGARLVGWPPVATAMRLRGDRTARLQLQLPEDVADAGLADDPDHQGAAARAVADAESVSGAIRAARATRPEPTPVQRARMDTAVRELVDKVSATLTPAWSDAVHREVATGEQSLGDALDAGIGGTDFALSRSAGWWRPAAVLQWLLFVVAVAGAVWLVLSATEVLSAPEWAGIGAGWWLLVGGLVLGIVLAVVFRLAVGRQADGLADAAREALGARVGEVTRARVVDPLVSMLDRYRRCREGLDAARS